MSDLSSEEWISSGRKTVQGYLLSTRGPRKRDYGLFGGLVVDSLEAKGAAVPRYPDIHAVWFGVDLDKPKGYQLVLPFLRYKRGRPIDGLHHSCSYHHVELTCTVGERWSNRLGAYITRAVGRCLECDAPPAEAEAFKPTLADLTSTVAEVSQKVNKEIREVIGR